MTHPNQSFIDKFNRPNKGVEGAPTYFYSQKFIEEKRKEKFQYFVESLNGPKKKNYNIIDDINKVFSYNTLSKNTNKPLLETKQSIGSLPQQFNYNGLLYAFNQELNMFVNQHGHAISIEQATAFMEMAQFEDVFDPAQDSNLDSSGDKQITTPQTNTPSPPINFQATLSSTLLDGVCFQWIDTSNNETGFAIYST
jgi:hypothetical protein